MEYGDRVRCIKESNCRINGETVYEDTKVGMLNTINLNIIYTVIYANDTHIMIDSGDGYPFNDILWPVEWFEKVENSIIF